MLENLEETDLKLLRVFQTVARCGGFSAAQAELNTSQSTISTQMAQLEGRLEMHLCDRGQAGFRVTQDGQTVLEAAEKLFAALEDFRSQIHESRSILCGELRLGCVDNMVTNPNGSVSLSLGRFRLAAPEARITLFVGDSADLEARVIDGRLHAGIGLFHRRLPMLRYKPVFTEEHAVYCARNHPLFNEPEQALTVDNLLGSDYVGWGFMESREPLKPDIPFEVSASTPFIEGVAMLIHSGCFIGFLPTHYAHQWVERGDLRALLPKRTTRTADVLIATRRGTRHSRLVRRFLSELERGHAS